MQWRCGEQRWTACNIQYILSTHQRPAAAAAVITHCEAQTISAGLNDRTDARQLVLLATPDDYIANIVSTLLYVNNSNGLTSGNCKNKTWTCMTFNNYKPVTKWLEMENLGFFSVSHFEVSAFITVQRGCKSRFCSLIMICQTKQVPVTFQGRLRKNSLPLYREIHQRLILVRH